VIQEEVAPRLRPGRDPAAAGYVDRVLVLLSEGGASARQLAEIDAERLLARLHAERVPELEAAFRLLLLLGKLL
jgi:hypothetical protein